MSILLHVRTCLSESGHHEAFNVEVVRPGTFTAFESHLHRKFDLVHFDLHGVIRKRKGKDVACLKFAAEDSPEDLIPVSAAKIATLLRKHHISLAVLNSCKSSQAGSSDDANLAKDFVRAGIAQVLAMSMSVSQTAALIFVRTFYGSMVLGHRDFIHSVSNGRKALRQQTQRPTRFGYHMEIKDWIIPTLYTSEVVSKQDVLGNLRPSLYNLHHSILGNSQSTGQAHLNGRHFDILRVERQMLERQIIFLTGQSGAGKTALLQTMKNLWESTSFVNWVSNIDFTAKIFPSAASVFTEMLLQLGLDADSASTYESTPIPELQHVLIDAIFNCNYAILFDGLQISHSALGETWFHLCFHKRHGICSTAS